MRACFQSWGRPPDSIDRRHLLEPPNVGWWCAEEGSAQCLQDAPGEAHHVSIDRRHHSCSRESPEGGDAPCWQTPVISHHRGRQSGESLSASNAASALPQGMQPLHNTNPQITCPSCESSGTAAVSWSALFRGICMLQDLLLAAVITDTRRACMDESAGLQSLCRASPVVHIPQGSAIMACR